MYLIRKPLAFIAIILASLSTLFCPFLKVFLVGDWNLYQVDNRLFFITNGILALVLFSIFIQKATILKFLNIVFFIWCLIAFVAVYFQINNFFGMQLADGLIAKSIHLKWGWLVLIGSSILLLFSTYKINSLGE